jgi:cell division protein ZipA
MDKELLRVMIISFGVLVMIGMTIWHFFKSLRERRDADDDDATFFGHRDDHEAEEEDDEVDERLKAVPESEPDDVLLDKYVPKPVPKPAVVQTAVKHKPAHFEVPKLIEFSLVARADQGFNGEELFEVFSRVDLKYGSVKVFERVDKNRLVDFAVASMIEPGTFPDTDLENFYCPGIVFYMQPRALDKPLPVFDDFIETIDTLAEELDGVVWDNQRQPLTAETIAQFRQMLI